MPQEGLNGPQHEAKRVVCHRPSVLRPDSRFNQPRAGHPGTYGASGRWGTSTGRRGASRAFGIGQTDGFSHQQSLLAANGLGCVGLSADGGAARFGRAVRFLTVQRWPWGGINAPHPLPKTDFN